MFFQQLLHFTYKF